MEICDSDEMMPARKQHTENHLKLLQYFARNMICNKWVDRCSSESFTTITSLDTYLQPTYRGMHKWNVIKKKKVCTEWIGREHFNELKDVVGSFFRSHNTFSWYSLRVSSCACVHFLRFLNAGIRFAIGTSLTSIRHSKTEWHASRCHNFAIDE